MRIRSLKPDFWTDDTIAVIAAEPALLFAGLWNFADDQGRFRWEPILVRAALDPYDTKFGGPAGIAKTLGGLERLGLVVRYEIEGRAYGLIRSSARHFHVNRPTPSRIPPPPDGLTERRKHPPGASVEHSVNVHGGGSEHSSLEMEMEMEMEMERSGEERKDLCAEPLTAVPAPAPLVVALMPCKGTGPKEYPVTAEKVAEWQDAFPAVDVLGEVKRLVQWARDNPTKRKTYRGAAAFFSRNLARKQDQSPTRKPIRNATDDLLRAALAEAEQYALAGEPPAGDGCDGRGDRGSPPLPRAENGVASDAAPLSAALRATLGDRRPARELQNPVHVEPGDGHGDP